MRGGGQENRFLAIHFLKSQVGGEKISISNLALLHQLLHRLPHLGFIGGRFGMRGLHVNDEPVRLRQPTNSGAAPSGGRIYLEIHFLLAALKLSDDAAAIGMKDVSKKIKFRIRSEPFGVQSILRVQVGEQNPAPTVGHDQGAVESVQKARDKVKNLLASRLRIGCNAFRQSRSTFFFSFKAKTPR